MEFTLVHAYKCSHFALSINLIPLCLLPKPHTPPHSFLLQDVEDLLSRAMEKRTVGCTALNEQSSRSHAVFTLRIEGVNDSSKLKVHCVGACCFTVLPAAAAAVAAAAATADPASGSTRACRALEGVVFQGCFIGLFRLFPPHYTTLHYTQCTRRYLAFSTSLTWLAVSVSRRAVPPANA